jgi:DNA-directed RNA polymerase specialized sigma24 family protein
LAIVTSEREERLSVLFRAYVAQVRGYVRTLAIPNDVDDIVAATFRTAWARLDDIPPLAQRAWLFGVVRNHVHNLVRAEGRRVALLDALLAFRPVGDVTLFGGHLDPIDMAPLLEALRRLSEEEREILQLKAWYDMDTVEIAEVLGIKPNAAKVRLHRARGRLNEFREIYAVSDVI